MRYNRIEARTGRRKSDSELVVSDVPAIVQASVFERVQAQLKARNPKITPPRVVSGPILLTGLAECASCSGAMTLRTGTSKSGQVYRYYTCSTCSRHGKSVCKGRSISMQKLDRLVIDQLIDRLLVPERLSVILEALATRRAENSAAVDKRINSLKDRAAEIEERLRRLYTLVEDGTTEADNILNDRISTLRAERDAVRAALDRAVGANRPPIVLPQSKIVAFGKLMRERLTNGEIPFRKAYLGSVIDRVQVDERVIRIFGRKDVLEQVLAEEGPTPGVRSFVRKWRPVGNSNIQQNTK
jgi:site-specific DNA recombinase